MSNNIAYPIYDNGTVVLWDMYIDGEWQGSRRTLYQVNEYFSTHGRKI